MAMKDMSCRVVSCRAVSCHVVSFAFSCSNYYINFDPFVGHISGIMGLDLSPHSLNSQLQALIGKRFSYCVIPYIEDPTFSMLRFGDDIP
ncbi:hypothetical protein Q3G72_002435 [Acer saccharum]|nr:hypothetical protein Q3G72_002435 [Acer saccharum]